MKEAIVHPDTKVDIVDSEIPKPGPDQLVIQVVVSGSNPKDWKVPHWTQKSSNTGDDIAGIVHSVGENVYEFKVGDRVASFHEMRTPGGSFAEYAVGRQHTTVHIPNNISFEEAAAIPLAALTAAVGLHLRLGLPQPWTPATSPTPLLVYGGSSAVGAYAIKLAVRTNIHPIVAVAGGGAKYVETLIDRSKGDTIVDYRKGDEATISGIKEALGGAKLECAFDAVSENGSYDNVAKALDPHGTITLVLPGKEYDIPKTIKQTMTMVGSAHSGESDFAYIYFRYLARGLQEGWFSGHPTEVVPGGLNGIEQGLNNLKQGKASAVKYVFRIADTPGVKGPSL